MNSRTIIGIVLIKNEDRFIEQVLTNILDFCDKIIVTDNGSTDKTVPIVKRLAARHPKIHLKHIDHPKESQHAIEEYAGSDTWIFGVDGDEIYDPAGLHKLKAKLQQGEYQSYWSIYGNVLNCIAFDENALTAKGYLAPPSRSMTKLYNFSLITSWTDCPERLHSGTKQFKPANSQPGSVDLYAQSTWEESCFRCLHMAFLPRSSTANNFIGKSKLNPSEIEAIRSAREHGSLIKLIKRQYEALFGSNWKNRKYRRGECVQKDVSKFFPLK